MATTKTKGEPIILPEGLEEKDYAKELARAIRAGIPMDGPQVFGSYFRIVDPIIGSEYGGDGGEPIIGTCALATAAVAWSGGLPEDWESVGDSGLDVVLGDQHLLLLNFPFRGLCPRYDANKFGTDDEADPEEGYCLLSGSRRLEDIVVHLSDQHRWTRERIADWLDTLVIGVGEYTEEVYNLETESYEDHKITTNYLQPHDYDADKH
jgi:hypothetical protein